MPGSSRGQCNRRSVLKSLGALSTVGALAGCTGGDNGNGATTGTPGSRREVVISAFPINLPMLEYVDQEGILADKLDAAGYDLQLIKSFESPPLFASENSDIDALSVLESARIGSERDQSLAVVGRLLTDCLGMVVRAGSEYDPAESGSRQATFDKVVEEGAPLGILGWAGSSIPPHQIIIQELFGYEFTTEGDFNVQEAGPNALTELLSDGDLDMTETMPSFGSAPGLMNGEFKPLYWGSDEVAKQGWGIATLNDWVTRVEFAEDHPDAIRALLEAMEEGHQWFHEEGVEAIPGNQVYMDHWQTEDPEVAEYITRWMLNEDVPASYETDTPIWYEDPYMTDEWIEGSSQFMDLAADIGQAPEGWEDYVEFVDV